MVGSAVTNQSKYNTQNTSIPGLNSYNTKVQFVLYNINNILNNFRFMLLFFVIGRFFKNIDTITKYD